jgi:hypothetical protein
MRHKQKTIFKVNMYKVIKSTLLEEVETRVNNAIKSGAKPVGGIFVIELHQNVLLWCQAVLYP